MNGVFWCTSDKKRFNSNIGGDDYFIVYTWGNYHGIFSGFGLRGHLEQRSIDDEVVKNEGKS